MRGVLAAAGGCSLPDSCGTPLEGVCRIQTYAGFPGDKVSCRCGAAAAEALCDPVSLQARQRARLEDIAQ